jgi:hypothetical protein
MVRDQKPRKDSKNYESDRVQTRNDKYDDQTELVVPFSEFVIVECDLVVGVAIMIV